jgi:hypothetical protein
VLRAINRLLVLSSLLAGCRSKIERSVSELESFRDEMCACKDQACVDNVDAKYAAWQEANIEVFSHEEKAEFDRRLDAHDADLVRGEKAGQAMEECAGAYGDNHVKWWRGAWYGGEQNIDLLPTATRPPAEPESECIKNPLAKGCT